MTQFDKILGLVGGKAKLARVTGRDKSQVTRWSRSGSIPPACYPALMDWAAAHGHEDDMLEIIGLKVGGVYIRATAW